MKLRKNQYSTGYLLTLLCTVSILMCKLPSAKATTVVISNERSGDLVFMNEGGQTTDIVELCGRPRGMVHRESTHTVFIACSDDNTVVEFDITDKAVKNVISDIPGAMYLAIHEASGRLIVSNEGYAKATVLDTKTGKTVASLPTGLEPDGVVLTPDGGKIFIASENAGLVHVFDGTTYQLIDNIITNLRPRRMAIRDQELWVSSEAGSSVEIFDTTTLAKIDNILFTPRGFRSEQLTPVDILFDHSLNKAFVALGSANHVVIIDANTRKILKYILVGRRPWGLELSPDGSHLFVLNGLSDDVTIIDIENQRPVRTSRTGLVPHSIEIIQ